MGVAGRGLDAMMKASTRMNLVAASQIARLNGLDLAVTMAPAGAGENSLGFDRTRMTALFEQGRTDAGAGLAWRAYDGAADLD
jgi:hypothetical protein